MNSQTASDHLWKSKPWWCQPWTIILTGVLIVAGSWLLFNSLWLTIPVALVMVAWWTYFLVIVPRLILKMMEENLSK